MIIIIVTILVLIILIGMYVISKSEFDPRCFVAFTACILLSIILGSAIVIEHRGGPTAMDVYRGKTTLQITYKDSVAIDSVVVYKDD